MLPPPCSFLSLHPHFMKLNYSLSWVSLALYTCLYLSHSIGPLFLPSWQLTHLTRQLYSINCISSADLCCLAFGPWHVLLPLSKALYPPPLPWPTNTLRFQLTCLLFQDIFPYTISHQKTKLGPFRPECFHSVLQVYTLVLYTVLVFVAYLSLCILSLPEDKYWLLFEHLSQCLAHSNMG